ncbi:acyl-ACP--UDP-N-acetylglucosamine O-acyltransferase [Pleionea sp. CnH1-48]|uniref:acyl-ACP--UDP-N-acetylglucosamine O-acyltransferase n=1 Tax=Pleionea sp. CnH1-48 TaxID=2954494 RepID=UPI0020982FF5|nr:acyl-ACP--UDP-N-acetylglucosamine O-acyltransferase [Pleionea sp. CnH1-48]MCO7226492.1 acyl-ACP--UDP-N-acetylglucosamine O-acyltransferase [Pleionea sp. CnH1-48]
MIHPSAIIDPKAELADDVEVGPYSIIGAHVQIDSGTVVGPHVVINGHTTIGKNNRFFQFSSIGEENQDKKYQGEPTKTIIGDNNVFRESCTVHRGTVQDIGYTQIGSDGLFMAYTHVAHDCIVGDHVIMANNATIAGHVHVGDWVILGGFTGVHQFCKIGAHAFAGMNSSITQDIPPYVMLQRGVPRAINTEGLKRRGFSNQDIRAVRNAFRELYRKEQKLDVALEAIKELAADNSAVQLFADFIAASERGIVR